MKLIYTSLAALALTGSIATAAPVILTCEMTDMADSGGWIPGNPVVQYDVAAKSAQLISPTAEQLSGKVGRAKLAMARKDRVVITWNVTGTRDNTGERAAQFRFSARYNPQTGDVKVIAKPKGFSNDFRASGTCKRG